MESKVENRKIDLRSILSDFKKNFFIILLLTAVITLTGHLLIKLFHKPVYETKLSYVVTSTEANVTASSSKKLVNIFKEVIDSNILKKTIISNMNYENGLPAEISSEIIVDTTSDIETNSNIIIVTVTSDNPKDAFDVASSIRDNCLNVSDFINDNAVLTLLDKPVYSEGDSKAVNFKKTDMIIFIGSFVLLSLLLAYLSFSRNTIKKSDEIREKLKIKLLATLPDVSLRSKNHKNTKQKILISNQNVGFYYIENIKKIRSKVQNLKKMDTPMSIAVASLMSGEGRTTIATNLALSLAMQSKVLLIDMDYKNPSVYKIFEQNKIKHDFSEFLEGRVSLKEAMVVDDSSPLKLMLQSTKVDNSSEIISSENLKVFLEYAKKYFDYVIIDTSAISVTADIEIFSEFVDKVLLVIKQDTAKAEDINNAIDMLERNKCELLGCVYNRDSRSTKDGDNGYNYNYGYGRYNNYSKKQGYNDYIKFDKNKK